MHIMRIKHIVLTTILGFLTINNLNAQSIGGNSLSILAPTSTLGDVYDVGLGFYGNLEIPINESLKANIEVGVTSWLLPDTPTGESQDEDNSYSIGLGGKYFLNKLFVGADAALFFGDISEFSVIPNVGIRLGKFNLETSISILDPVNYVGFEIGYFWQKNN